MPGDAAEAEFTYDDDFVDVPASLCEEMIFDLAAQISLLEDEISQRQARQLDRIEQQIERLWTAMNRFAHEEASK